MFNILLVNEQENRHVVHCIGCARKHSPTLQGFVCLKEYRLSELSQIYDAFILHDPPPPPPPLPITTIATLTHDKDKDSKEKLIPLASPAHAKSPFQPSQAATHAPKTSEASTSGTTAATSGKHSIDKI